MLRKRSWPSEEARKRPHPEMHRQRAIFKKTLAAHVALLGKLLFYLLKCPGWNRCTSPCKTQTKHRWTCRHNHEQVGFCFLLRGKLDEWSLLFIEQLLGSKAKISVCIIESLFMIITMKLNNLYCINRYIYKIDLTSVKFEDWLLYQSLLTERRMATALEQLVFLLYALFYLTLCSRVCILCHS